MQAHDRSEEGETVVRLRREQFEMTDVRDVAKAGERNARR
jgi:hypothetical protein